MWRLQAAEPTGKPLKMLRAETAGLALGSAGRYRQLEGALGPGLTEPGGQGVGVSEEDGTDKVTSPRNVNGDAAKYMKASMSALKIAQGKKRKLILVHQLLRALWANIGPCNVHNACEVSVVFAAGEEMAAKGL